MSIPNGGTGGVIGVLRRPCGTALLERAKPPRALHARTESHEGRSGRQSEIGQRIRITEGGAPARAGQNSLPRSAQVARPVPDRLPAVRGPGASVNATHRLPPVTRPSRSPCPEGPWSLAPDSPAAAARSLLHQKRFTGGSDFWGRTPYTRAPSARGAAAGPAGAAQRSSGALPAAADLPSEKRRRKKKSSGTSPELQPRSSATRAEAPRYSDRMRTSTRRFSNRPFSVLLSPMGSAFPRPEVWILAASTPCFTR